jgi:hypothetical protein
MEDEEALGMERVFWTSDADHCRRAIDPSCIMAFPAPTGIMSGPEIVRSLADTPRWSSVVMTETHFARPAPDLLVLAYRAEGRRDGLPPYRAYCTSTYRLSGRRWLLVQHQQTPA